MASLERHKITLELIGTYQRIDKASQLDMNIIHRSNREPDWMFGDFFDSACWLLDNTTIWN